MTFGFILVHIAVLKKEVLKYLDPKPNENFIDCTLGLAGHTKAILEKNKPNGKVLGIEWDPVLYKKILAEKIDGLILVNDSYRNLEKIIKEQKFRPIAGILLDLGISSWHLKESGRGFSFKKEEALDMRYNPELQKIRAGDIINQRLDSEIERILREYGEEKFAKRIAKEIVAKRKIRQIKTTFDLVKVIMKAVPAFYLHQRIHFATRTFQALRIAVNNEMENLKEVLPQALKILTVNGKLVVISFHSLEDRLVKNFLRDKKNSLKIIIKKPVRPGQEEIQNNPRSRSAKLRAAIKL